MNAPAVHVPESDHLILQITGPGDSWWTVGCINTRKTFIAEDDTGRGGIEATCPHCNKHFTFTRASAMERSRDSEARRQARFDAITKKGLVQ